MRIELWNSGKISRNFTKKIICEGNKLNLPKIETYNGQIWVENRIEGDHSKGSNFIILLQEAD